MASISYPAESYNSGAISDLEYERLASTQSADGLIGSPSDPPLVWADGTGTRRVYILANRRAQVRGFHYDSGPSTITLTLAANSSGLPRVDLIVLRLNRATWTVREDIVQGTPGAGAPTRTMNTGSIGVWEFPLAEVTVDSGVSAIVAGKVTRRSWYVGDDGQIRCTSATRPEYDLGRTFWEEDTSRFLLGVAGGWRVVHEDTGWVSFSPSTGWSPLDCRGRRLNGWIYLQCDVARVGTLPAGTGSDLAVIPSQLRPPLTLHLTGIVVTGNGLARVTIESNGLVRLQSAEIQVGNTGHLRVSHAYPG